MSLIKWEPFNEIDRFFDDRSLSSNSRHSWNLAVDVYEEKGNLVAKMCMPEIDENSLEVTIEDNKLTITGKREEEKEVEKKDYYSKEIKRGSFYRTVQLPKRVDEKSAQATYENGVLELTAPIAKGAVEKRIKVSINKK